MEIVVKGRHCTVNDELREHVEQRIATIERLKDRIIRVEVEFTAIQTKGSKDDAMEVEITMRSKGPVVRAEATSDDKVAGFEKALERLKSQLRKAADRRKNHRGLRPAAAVAMPEPEPEPEQEPEEEPVPTKDIAGIVVEGDGPLVVRKKEFPATPLTLAQALDEMELVGHDFFLFVDAETKRPSVVYRRKAYNYGVIALDITE